MKVSNIYNPISEAEKKQVYQRLLKIFVLSGGSTNDKEDNNEEHNEERCSICKAEPR